MIVFDFITKVFFSFKLNTLCQRSKLSPFCVSARPAAHSFTISILTNSPIRLFRATLASICSLSFVSISSNSPAIPSSRLNFSSGTLKLCSMKRPFRPLKNDSAISSLNAVLDLESILLHPGLSSISQIVVYFFGQFCFDLLDFFSQSRFKCFLQRFYFIINTSSYYCFKDCCCSLSEFF